MIDSSAPQLAAHRAEAPAQPAVVRLETAAYIALAALALILRLAELDVVPLSAAEAREALAAQRAVAVVAPGEGIVPQSALLFAVQAASFSLLGASEFTVRLATAVAGALLVLTPLLFRRLLNPTRTLALSALLTFSPVALLTAREASPAVWTLLCAAGGLWAAWRCWETRQHRFALLAAALFTGVFFLTDPAGVWLTLTLLAAAGGAVIWLRSDEPDYPGLAGLPNWLGGLPWLAMLAAAALTVFVASTVFALYLPGLGAVSEALQRAAAGLTVPAPDTLPAFPLLVIVFYEPATIAFAAVGVWLLGRRINVPLLDRFLVIWLLLSALAAVFYPGGMAAHALWLIAPLCGLAAVTVTELLAEDRHPLFHVPWWGRWMAALVVILLLAILTINLQAIGRALLAAPPGAEISARIPPLNLIWAVIALLLGVLGVLLMASLWGRAAALRGAGLGLLVFALVTSLGSGWNAAVPNATSPVELWHLRAPAQETALLRATLAELAWRETSAFPLIRVYAQVEQDSPAAWLLRDYPSTTFITRPSDARAQPIALLPPQAEPPPLGGSYVGQQFVVRRAWSPQTMPATDLLAWWLQRRVRIAPSAETLVLWLRQDVYDGQSLEGGWWQR